MKQLNEKVAVVTGAGQGIGKGIALCLAKRGVKVIATGRRLEPIEATIAEIRELGGEGFAMTCDSADRARGGVPGRPRLLLLLRPVRDRGRRQLHHAVARNARKRNERRPALLARRARRDEARGDCHGLLHVVGDGHEAGVGRGYVAAPEHGAAQPVHEAVPVRVA